MKTLEDLAREAGAICRDGKKHMMMRGWSAIRSTTFAEEEDLARFAALVRAQALDEAAAVAQGARNLPNDGKDFANGWCSASLQIEQAIRALKGVG